MSVIVACEYSGAVRDQMLALGIEALSCDLLPTETEGPHYLGDVRDVIANPLRYLSEPPRLMVAHPPCTYLSGSGARWLTQTPAKPKPGVLYGAERRAAQVEAVEFVRELMEAPIEHVAVENPVGMLKSLYRPADQFVQPWQFGHGEIKRTGLWLKNLPPLVPTDIVPGREARVHRMPPGPDRSRERSRTYAGMARAMADQWGRLVHATAIA